MKNGLNVVKGVSKVVADFIVSTVNEQYEREQKSHG